MLFFRRFGGYLTDEILVKEARDLAELLKASNETGVDYSNYYFAGYDPPFKPINRRNEVWFIKTVDSNDTSNKNDNEVDKNNEINLNQNLNQVIDENGN